MAVFSAIIERKRRANRSWRKKQNLLHDVMKSSVYIHSEP